MLFGRSTRVPNSLDETEARHSCEQGDNLASYGWTEFDAREGGVQVLKDNDNNLKLTTEFLKVPGGMHGGSWAARVKGEPLDAGTTSLLLDLNYTSLTLWKRG